MNALATFPNILTFPLGGAQQALDRVGLGDRIKRMFGSPMGRGAFVQPLGGEAAGGGVFSPSDIVELDLWLQPSDVSQSDNTAISSVTMSVGGSATQGAGVSQPTWQTSELNGYGVIRFDGSDALRTSVNASQKPLTWFAVVKPTDFAAERSIVAASADGRFHWFTGSTTGVPIVTSQATAFISAATTGLTAGSFQIVAFTYSSGGVYAHYLGGVLDGTGTNNVAFTSGGNVDIGAYYAAGVYWWLGDIAEMLRFSTVLSTTNLNNVGSYLAAKYGLTWTGL